MKKLYFSLLLLLVGSTLYASHYAGGEIRYEYTGIGNRYRVFVTAYKACSPGNFSLNTAVNVSFASTNCGQSFVRLVPRVSFDTLTYMYCPNTAPLNACTTPNSSFPGIEEAIYSDTVTLTPCSDWKIIFSDFARSGNITNLDYPTNQGIYLEAHLNNLAAINSSASIASRPPLAMGVSGHFSTPLYATDPDGDQVYSTLITPSQNVGGLSPVIYAPGYSAAQPFGSGGYAFINPPNPAASQSLQLMSTTLGTFVMAMRTYEVRNNQIIGYSSRDWNTTVMAGTNVKQPFPAGAFNQNITTCPGQSHTVTYSFQDSVATDSIFVTFTTPTNGITFTTSSNPAIGTGSGTIAWTTPASWNPATAPFFKIRIFTRNNNCPVRGASWYDVIVRVAPCVQDSVWAGDANGDKAVNVYDPLSIAVHYSATGPVRPNASTAWTAQACPNWPATQLNGMNLKHADCNGDGTVNSNDLAAVTANYGLTHPRGGSAPNAKVTGVPDLYFDRTGVTASPGMMVNIPIKLGNTGMTMANLYGLAGTIRITGITPMAPSLTYPQSWLGSVTNTVRFTKNVTTNTVDWAYARTDHQHITGQGTLATLSFMVPASVASGQKIVLTMEDMQLIDAAGNELTDYNVLTDTLTVQPAGIGSAPSVLMTAAVVPNPSGEHGTLQLSLSRSLDLSIAVTDIAGRVVWQASAVFAAGPQQVAMPAASLPSGIYLVRITGIGLSQPTVLKWVRQ